MAFQIWEAFEESVTVYTGLSPASIITAVAVGLAIYYLALCYFGSSTYDDSQDQGGHGGFEEKVEPLPPPVQVGEITDVELRQYDGSDPKKPLLMAIKGQIYDVTQSRMFYGPGGPYALFAGRDAGRALAKMSFEEKDLNGNLTGLGVFELEALQDWEYKFMSKYVKVGTVKPITVEAREGHTTETCESDSVVNPKESSSEQAAEGGEEIKDNNDDKKE